METEYVYHDAVLLKAALAGSVFSLNVWLYPVLLCPMILSFATSRGLDMPLYPVLLCRIKNAA